jgi:hypothetical protein
VNEESDVPEELAEIEREFVEQVREELYAMRDRLLEIEMLYCGDEEAA